jgi:hypothetical protein
MPFFRPPTDPFVTWSDETTEGIFKYLKAWPRGRNVYKLLDGSFTEYQPSDMTTVDKIYHGGHIHEIDANEEADLIAAGYEDYIEAS